MRKFIGLILLVGVSFTASASFSDYDVGHDNKSECLADLSAFDVAILPEVINTAFNLPTSVTKIPVSCSNVKPSKAVNIFRRSRDGL